MVCDMKWVIVLALLGGCSPAAPQPRPSWHVPEAIARGYGGMGRMCDCRAVIYPGCAETRYLDSPAVSGREHGRQQWKALPRLALWVIHPAPRIRVLLDRNLARETRVTINRNGRGRYRSPGWCRA
jgi:hypothetical protein